MAKKRPAARRGSARERLLAAAEELFYGEGINTVGIDRVIEHAGVAKASLYDCFGSKEGLIQAYLTVRHEGRQKTLRVRATLTGEASTTRKTGRLTCRYLWSQRLPGKRDGTRAAMSLLYPLAC